MPQPPVRPEGGASVCVCHPVGGLPAASPAFDCAVVAQPAGVTHAPLDRGEMSLRSRLVGSPAFHGSASADGAGALASGCHRDEPPVGCVQLPARVGPPALDRAVGAQSASVVAAGRDGCEAPGRYVPQVAGVMAPALDPAVDPDRAVVAVAGSEGLELPVRRVEHPAVVRSPALDRVALRTDRAGVSEPAATAVNVPSAGAVAPGDGSVTLGSSGPSPAAGSLLSVPGAPGSSTDVPPEHPAAANAMTRIRRAARNIDSSVREQYAVWRRSHSAPALDRAVAAQPTGVRGARVHRSELSVRRIEASLGVVRAPARHRPVDAKPA